jgi:hypothetical protein
MRITGRSVSGAAMSFAMFAACTSDGTTTPRPVAPAHIYISDDNRLVRMSGIARHTEYGSQTL